VELGGPKTVRLNDSSQASRGTVIVLQYHNPIPNRLLLCSFSKQDFVYITYCKIFNKLGAMSCPAPRDGKEGSDEPFPESQSQSSLDLSSNSARPISGSPIPTSQDREPESVPSSNEQQFGSSAANVDAFEQSTHQHDPSARSNPSQQQQEALGNPQDMMNPVHNTGSLQAGDGTPPSSSHANRDEIKDFMKEFEDHRSDWEQLKDYAIGVINDNLKNSEILAQVTGRVKSNDSLEKKLRARNAEKPYISRDDILNNQIDFVGLRIALYFPDQKREVIQILKRVFDYHSTTTFERDWKYNRIQVYEKRFGEYTADHIWVHLKPEDGSSNFQQKRLNGIFGAQIFEIQLRSVLMHAWADISQKLEYKLLTGALSGAELKLLDTVKGQVEAAELVLEMFHQVHLKRLKTDMVPISSALEVEEIITDYVPQAQLVEWPMGDIEFLLKFLRRLEVATPRLFRELMSEADVRSHVPTGLEEWARNVDPLPATVSYYIIYYILRNIGRERRRGLIEAGISEPKHFFESRVLNHSLWQVLVWLHDWLRESADASHRRLTSAQTERCAAIWCAYLWTDRTTPEFERNLFFCTPGEFLPPQDVPTLGIDFIVDLSMLSLLPAKWHVDFRTKDPIYELLDALSWVRVLSNFAVRGYHENATAWESGIRCFRQMFTPTGHPADPYFGLKHPSREFWTELSIITWLASLKERELLEEFVGQAFLPGGSVNSVNLSQRMLDLEKHHHCADALRYFGPGGGYMELQKFT
jgi:ppGpp synthetase/RelA/SpoT-type nucleotidyltranferase